MATKIYDELKNLINYYPLPSMILSVEKNPDGSCGDIRFFAVNEPFKRSFYVVFAEKNNFQDVNYDELDKFIEGRLYTDFIPKEPKFEDIAFRSAWQGDHIHTYVDTTMMYGYWTEDLLLPISCAHDDNVAYCNFMYSLSKEMDAETYSNVSPDISNFVVKTCLEMNSERDFISNMNIITKDLREFTDSFTACMISVDRKNRSFEVISESILNNMFSAREVFQDSPFEMLECWDDLLKETNGIIIKDEMDMLVYEDLAPEWVATLRRDNVKSLCLFPFKHDKEILGYLYIANFDTAETMRLKKTVELVSYFLSSEFANYQLLK